MAGRYIITTPLNPDYSGKVCGVRIDHGRGVIDSTAIDPKTGYSVMRVLSDLVTLNGVGSVTQAALPEGEATERVLASLVNLGGPYRVEAVAGLEQPDNALADEGTPIGEGRKGTGYHKQKE